MRRLAISSIAVLALAACSADEGDFKDQAEDFIEDDDGELAGITGVTWVDAACDEPASTDVGTTFVCTATGSDGQTWDFAGEITADDEFSLLPAAAGTTGGTATPGTATPGTATGDTTASTTPTS